MEPRRANLITAAGLVALMVAVAWSAPRWSRLLTRSLPGTGPEEEETAPTSSLKPSAEEASRAVERQINVKLFFPAADRPGLTIEERGVAFSNDLSRQLRSVVEELVAGPKSGGVPAFLPSTKVLDVFFSSRGIAYVDLSKEAGQGHPGGSASELIAVYSVVDSLVSNFPAVKRVQILIEDKPAATLAGHVDLTRPLTADMTFLADVARPPGASAAASTSPGGAP
jgi:spore germination protein GerM